MSSSAVRVGIVIVTYGIIPEKLLKSIEGTSNKITYYIYHHGSESLAKELTEFFSLNENAKLYLYCENRGLAKSWNEGILQSFTDNNDVTLVLNDDIEFFTNMFDGWISYILNSGNAALVFCHGIDEIGGSKTERSQDFSCFSIRKPCFDIVGAFDERFSPAYYEDTDYYRRVVLSKLIVKTDTTVRIRHERSSTIRNNPEIANDLHRFFEINKVLYYSKWGQHEEFELPYNNPSENLYIDFKK